MNDKTKTIYTKLADARTEFHSSSITKTGWNDYSKYSYFELSDFLVPALRIMSEHGLVPIVSFGMEMATMTVYDVTSEATIVITSPMSTADLKACQPVQSLGAVETFQRRYLWVALLEIVEHDVVEGAGDRDTEGVSADEPPQKMATDKQIVTIRDFYEDGHLPQRRKAWLNTPNRENVTGWTRLTFEQANTILEECKQMEKSA